MLARGVSPDDVRASVPVKGSSAQLLLASALYEAGYTGEADENGAYAGLVYLKCTAENGFVAEPPQRSRCLIHHRAQH